MKTAPQKAQINPGFTSCARNPGRLILFVVLGIMLSMDGTALGCSTCFGESGSPMGRGLGMGVLALLGVVVSVLSGFAAFFVYLVKRSSALSSNTSSSDHYVQDGGSSLEVEINR